jgi:hypothetical protein
MNSGDYSNTWNVNKNIPPNKCGTINLKLLHSALLPPLVWCCFLGLPKRWCCTHKTIRHLLTINESLVLCLEKIRCE